MALKPGQPKPLLWQALGEGQAGCPRACGLFWGTTPHHPPTQPFDLPRITSLLSSRPSALSSVLQGIIHTYIHTCRRTNTHSVVHSSPSLSLSLSLCLTAIQSLTDNILLCSMGLFHFRSLVFSQENKPFFPPVLLRGR